MNRARRAQNHPEAQGGRCALEASADPGTAIFTGLPSRPSVMLRA